MTFELTKFAIIGMMLLFSSALKQFNELIPSSTEMFLNVVSASAAVTLTVLH